MINRPQHITFGWHFVTFATAVLILSTAVLILSTACALDTEKGRLRKQVREKYGESAIVWIQKEWKASTPEVPVYDIVVKTPECDYAFSVLQDSLEENDYCRVYWSHYAEDIASKVANRCFDGDFDVYVHIVKGYTDIRPGIDPVIPYKEFMENYCKVSKDSSPDNSVRLTFSEPYSDKNYQKFFKELTSTDLIFDSLLLTYSDYRFSIPYDDVKALAENYDKTLVESFEYGYILKK